MAPSKSRVNKAATNGERQKVTKKQEKRESLGKEFRTGPLSLFHRVRGKLQEFVGRSQPAPPAAAPHPRSLSFSSSTLVESNRINADAAIRIRFIYFLDLVLDLRFSRMDLITRGILLLSSSTLFGVNFPFIEHTVRSRLTELKLFIRLI